MFLALILKVASENLVLTCPLVSFVPISDRFRARHKKKSNAANNSAVSPNDTAIAT